MTDPAAQRAYVKEISSAIPEFNGQKIHLQRFVTALKLVDLTKGTFEYLAVEVVKSKIVGSTLYKVQNELTIKSIIQKLQDTIVGEISDVVKAKMAKTSQKGKTAEKFTNEIDNLRKLLEAYTHKKETTIVVITSEIIIAVGLTTEVIIKIMDITKTMVITKITVITETIITRPTVTTEVVVIIEETTVVETIMDITPITTPMVITIPIQTQTDKITTIMSDKYKQLRKTNKDP
ncbi:uncharacterized protein LOC123037561 [Drosophila rhopaloa]|uniref:Uncharacterized protein n=1 Tax=Drosophila rhopaloa TaxID=1041015 RepID=A0ABM5J7E3_DRORH|nr:uncharacterized protein LOC123037561 [Drosophila rhopaloa]